MFLYLRSFKYLAQLASVLLLVASCETTSDPNQPPTSMTEKTTLQPVGVALGGPPLGPLFIWLASDVRTKLSNGKVCIDSGQTEAKWRAGTYAGEFPNCPGVRYTIVVHQGAPAISMLISTFAALAILDFDATITMPDGTEYTDISRMW